MQNIDISGVGSMCCTWCCTYDAVGVSVPRDQFSVSHFGKKIKISKSKVLTWKMNSIDALLLVFYSISSITRQY